MSFDSFFLKNVLIHVCVCGTFLPFRVGERERKIDRNFLSLSPPDYKKEKIVQCRERLPDVLIGAALAPFPKKAVCVCVSKSIKSDVFLTSFLKNKDDEDPLYPIS